MQFIFITTAHNIFVVVQQSAHPFLSLSLSQTQCIKIPCHTYTLSLTILKVPKLLRSFNSQRFRGLKIRIEFTLDTSSLYFLALSVYDRQYLH